MRGCGRFQERSGLSLTARRGRLLISIFTSLLRTLPALLSVFIFVDRVQVNAYTVDAFFLFSAERFDFVLDTTVETGTGFSSGNFWMRAEVSVLLSMCPDLSRSSAILLN